jgi:hypothetical protein
MVIRILLRQIDHGSFVLVSSRRIILEKILTANTSFKKVESHSQLPSDINQVVLISCHYMLVFVQFVDVDQSDLCACTRADS